MTPWVVATLALIGVAVAAYGWWQVRREADRLRAIVRLLSPTNAIADVAAAEALLAQQTAESTRQRSELQAAQAEASLLQPLLSGLAHPILIVDAEERLLAWNAMSVAVLLPGATPRTGARLRDLCGSFTLLDAIHHATTSGEVREVEGEAGPGRGQVYAMQVIPVETASGRRVVALLTDRTSTAAFRELRREFVTNVTHELKTPLTNIVGATETLLSGAMEDPEFRGRFLEIIQRNADQLRALIEDLLLIARSEEESAPLGEGEECEYRSVRDMVLRDLHAAADAAEVSLKAQPLNAGLTLLVAAADCYTILKNLTENAIRYNKPGGVVEYSERRLEHALEISIRDTGIGIQPADLPRVFERFYRADKHRSRSVGGTGLGLAIVRNLVERHGGSVDVMSKPGLGSTFVVTLPLATADQILLAAAE